MGNSPCVLFYVSSFSVFIHCTDYYASESFWILLDTTNWWAWGSDGWNAPSESYECGSWSATVPAGSYILIAGDSYGDGGLYGDVSPSGVAHIRVL